MLPDITEEELQEVIDFYRTLAETKYHLHKKKLFAGIAVQLSKNALWLFTFACWWCSFNLRWNVIDDSNYHTIEPADVNTVTFKDFITLVRAYNKKKVVPSREADFVKFLSRCDEAHRMFYMALFTKSFIKALPVADTQLVLDLDSIEVQDIYGPVEILQTSFADLQYPVAITAADDLTMPFCIFSKTSGGVISRRFEEGQFVKTPSVLQNDSLYIQTPKYLLAGFAQSYKKHSVFNAVDYFGSMKEFYKYFKGKEAMPYPERIQLLRKFQADNMLTQVNANYIGLAHSEDEVLSEVLKVMENSEWPYVCFSDQNSARTGKAIAIKVRVTVGIIDSFWVENGSPRGFMVWFNGKLTQCPFDFKGKHNALLSAIKPLRGKLLEFLYLSIGNSRVAYGRKILYDKPLWRNRKLRYSNIKVEKCIFCGETSSAHNSRGMCVGCAPMLHYHYANSGPGVWITPSGHTKRKRYKAAWEHTLMNNIKYRFKDCYLESAENGDWWFVPDPEAGKEFELWLNKLKKDK